MEFLERDAKKIAEKIERKQFHDLRELRDAINNTLINYHRDEIQLQVLSQAKGEMQILKDKHEENCPHGAGSCQTSKNYVEGLFIISQEIDKLNNNIDVYGDFNRFNASFKGETYSLEEISELKGKLDELSRGQEILFDDITELKELLHVLNKKNWGEMAKGKVFDLAFSGALKTEFAKDFLMDLGLGNLVQLLQ